jgi:hypothetical protein
MPPLQVILLDYRRRFEALRDEELKLLTLIPAQIDALPEREAVGDGPFADLLPRAAEARRAQARLEQRIGLLRHVEALRLHAAAHDGKLPEKLEDVELPLPPDPFTGKPFDYTLDGTAARLRCGAPKGGENHAAFGRQYEVTIRK